MKKIYSIIMFLIGVIIIATLFIFNQKPSQETDDNLDTIDIENKNAQITENQNKNTPLIDDQNKDEQPKSGIIETKILQDLTPQDILGNPIVIDKRVSLDSALAPECQDANYLEERADYIIEAGVSNIKIDQAANTKTINLGIVAWLKGRKETNALQILTSNTEQGESVKLKEGGIYKIYLWESGDKLYFVCEFAGVVDLGYKAWYCHETDKGRNYHEKGTATVFFNGTVYGPYSDACGSSSILAETVCDNDRKYILEEFYLCNTSCLEGACTL